jgi:hypothetical protein
VSKKLQDQLAYPPRGMRAPRASAYLDMSQSKFLELVEQRRLSQPVHIDGMAIWDRHDLDADFEAMKTEPGEPNKLNTADMVLGQTK